MITTPVKLWRRQKQVSLLIGKTGNLLNWSLIRVPAKGFSSEAPYPIVIVEMPDKKKLIGQLVDYEAADLKKGRKVRAVLRKLTPEHSESVISYTIKFTPAP